MSMRPDFENAAREPVPPASQLMTLPFLSALDGFLRGSRKKLKLRMTLHRAMNREGQVFLQQVCAYVGPETKEDRTGTGRVFPVTFGIMGEAFSRSRVLRTRRFPSVAELRSAIAADMQTTGEPGDPRKKRLSWLAVPIVGPDNRPVLVLFADTYAFNFFASDSKVASVLDMCRGFCRLIDALEEQPIPKLRNFPFEDGVRVLETKTVYPTVQEELENVAIPRLQSVGSFNYEAVPY
jgi:hypothetical protein